MPHKKSRRENKIKSFNWSVAMTATERKEADFDRTCAVLIAFHRQFDPDHKKAMARLSRVYSKGGG